MKSLMVMVALTVFSCNTDDSIDCPDPLTGELSAEESQFSGTWTLVAKESDVAIDLTDDEIDNPSKDIFAQNKECDRDLILDFKTNRNYEEKFGHTAVDCENKLSFGGTWGLAGNDLTFVGDCSSQRISIKKNEEGNQFSYETTGPIRDVNGVAKTVKLTFTYEKDATEPQPE